MIATTPETQTKDMARKNDFLDGFRVIHLHPTLRCNLSCKHCYSSSSPNLKGELKADEIVAFLEYAWKYGFNALSVSGGEPFLYSGLEAVLAESKRIGYKNLIATNAMLLKSARATRILDLTDVVAVSVDGDEALHDEVRNFKGAYAKMLNGLEILKALKKDFGIIHTLTPRSWELLLPLSEFAYEQGAKLLQLHPLEMYGRATTDFNAHAVNQEFLHKTFILGNYLKSKYAPDMTVQLDFLHREYIAEYPKVATYFGADFQANTENFAKAVKTIIINEQGNILPVSYGFSDDFKIGHIANDTEGMFEQFLHEKWEGFYDILEKTYLNIINDTENDLVAWTELIVKNSLNN